MWEPVEQPEPAQRRVLAGRVILVLHCALVGQPELVLQSDVAVHELAAQQDLSDVRRSLGVTLALAKAHLVAQTHAHAGHCALAAKRCFEAAVERGVNLSKACLLLGESIGISDNACGGGDYCLSGSTLARYAATFSIVHSVSSPQQPGRTRYVVL